MSKQAWWAAAAVLPLVVSAVLDIPYRYVMSAVSWVTEEWFLYPQLLSDVVNIGVLLLVALVLYGPAVFVALRLMQRGGAPSITAWIVSYVSLSLALWWMVSWYGDLSPDPEFARSPYFLLSAAAPGLAMMAGAIFATRTDRKGATTTQVTQDSPTVQ